MGGSFFSTVPWTCEGLAVLRSAIAAQTVRHDQHEIRYTISLGAAEMGVRIEGPKQWIECADRALYDAKHGGRNRVA